LIYQFIKIWVRLSLKIFCKEVIIYNRQQLATTGPLIIAAHHPNSFFDAILVGAYMHQPVHFITRGDVFRHPWVKFILTRLKMIPIYRIRDGKEKLSLNQQTFDLSLEILKQNGILLIFVEGLCDYQTTLLPLKKGAPRIIFSCWQQDIDTKILPLWLRYNSFSSFCKKIELNFGNIFGKEAVKSALTEGETIRRINALTQQELLALYNINKSNTSLSSIFRYLVAIPAFAGVIINLPLYFPVKIIVKLLTQDTPHYDGVMFVVLTLLYPFYLAILSLAFFYFTGSGYSFSLIILCPLLARCYGIWKK
jgi:1-acyl-sn-glycerol-3-phosphate acyltransferase